MGLWGTKNYDNEIALLNKGQNELSEKTAKNKSDIIAIGEEFESYKEGTNLQMKNILELINKLHSEMDEMQKANDEKEKEERANKKAKSILPDTLTDKELCSNLTGFTYLTPTSLKYYLYECGILDLKINKVHNRYKLSKDYAKSTSEIKNYIYITDGVITFNKDILDYFDKNSQNLQNSIYRYLRKCKQFADSKQHLSEVEIKNYQDEIGKICGVNNKNGENYDAQKWKLIYKRYSLDHKNWTREYETWASKFLEEHPNFKFKKPSKVMYLVQVIGDGDVLLKIACELFVD